MDPSLYTQWVQHPQLLPDSPQHAQHDPRPTGPLVDDWSKGRSTPTTQTGATTSSHNTTTLDLSDFTTLGDIPATSTSSSSSMASPTQSFFTSFPHGSYFLPSSYNQIPYGSPWPTAAVPLSNYSTLNGATSASSSTSSNPASQPSVKQAQAAQVSPSLSPLQSQQQAKQSSQTQTQPQPQPQPIATQPMVIDPALTTMSSSTSNALQQLYAQSSHYSSHQQPRSQLQPSQLHHLSYVLPYYRQQHQSPQGTLSPQALHTPSSSLLSGVPASSFYGQLNQVASTSSGAHNEIQSQASSGLSSQERIQQFQAFLKPLLQPSAFTGAQAVSTLVQRITDFGSQDVDPTIRLEILTKIRDGAGNHYFRAWSENVTAVDITREWLKAAFTAKDDESMMETIMPLLHIIDRLPLTVDSLKASKLGKIVVKLVKEPPSPAIKDMASNVERKWRSIIDGATSKQQADKPIEEKGKKRKPSEPPAKNLPPAKKVAIGIAPSSKPVVIKKETKPIPPAVKDAKLDTSFFSAPKPKPKLPSFKKAPPTPATVKKEPDPNVAQPSSIDPFQEALKSMAKIRKENSAVSTPPPNTQPIAASTPPPGLSKNGKRKKTVTWAPEGQLESVRLIEKAVYDDDPVDGIHTPHSLRDLDRGEGAALHAHLFEEALDWLEPLLIEMPIDIEMHPRGVSSIEKVSQEEREATALGAVYSSAHIPDSPAEPGIIMPDEEVDREVKRMTSGPEVDAIFWSSEPIPPNPQLVTVSELVQQLTKGVNDPTLNGMMPFNGLDFQALGLNANPTLSAMQALPQEQVQVLLQQLRGQQPQSNQMPPQGSHYDNGEQTWTATPHHFPTDFGQSNNHDDPEQGQWADGRGRGRGRGRGGRGRGDDGFRHHNKRKPCSFFAAGRCKYGDQCDFSHEVHS